MLSGSWRFAEAADSSPVPMQLHLCKFDFHSRLQLPMTDAQHTSPGLETCFLAHSCSAEAADNSPVPLELHLCKFAFHARLQVPKTDAQHTSPG